LLNLGPHRQPIIALRPGSAVLLRYPFIRKALELINCSPVVSF
jgi:hypothetical protein